MEQQQPGWACSWPVLLQSIIARMAGVRNVFRQETFLTPERPRLKYQIRSPVERECLPGMVPIKARSTALTDSGVAKTSATSGSSTTNRLPGLTRAAKRFGRALL